MSLFISLVLLLGCRQETARKIQLTFVEKADAGDRSIAIPQGYSLTTSEEYDELLRWEVLECELVDSVTPDYIILDLGELQLFNSEDVQANIFNTSGNSVKIYDDYHGAFNMLHTRGLELYVPNSISNAWHHLLMFFTSWTGQATYTAPSGYNDYFTVNIVGVKLPASIPEGKIQGIVFSEREREYLMSFIPDFEEYVWLSFSSLTPFNCSTPSAIVFSDTITSPQVYSHKAGEDISHYCIGDGNPEDSSNITIVELPISTLDFSGIENPELVLSYDAESLINFYADDEGGYHVFFNPDNPFPLSLGVREMSYETDGSAPSASGGEVPPPIGCSKNRFMDTEDGQYMEILFTMPNDSNVKGVEILYSTTDDISTAKLLYEGCSVHFRHKPDNPDPDSNFYWIRSIAVDGRQSEFIEIPTGYYAEK